MNGDALLTFEGIGKSFAGVRVLHAVSFAVGRGRTVGLVGENGAGKSTLMNVLGGNLSADAGRMRFDGRDYQPAGPAEAARWGVAFVHQELNLFANLSIAENLFLTSFPLLGLTAPSGSDRLKAELQTRSGRGWLPLIDRRRLHERAATLLREVGLDLSTHTSVERLSAGERQLVEIAKALGLDARLIILDEPTTSLSARESERLFALLGRLRARGIALIYISHNLGEILRLCDDLVVLRDGAVVGQGPRTEFDADRMIALMVGRSLNQIYPARAVQFTASAESGGWQREARHPLTPSLSPSGGEGARRAGEGEVQGPNARARSGGWLLNERGQGTVALEVAGLRQPGVVRDVNFALHRGEVLGISGLMGAGRSELARILFGLDPCATGEVRLNGAPIARDGLRRRIQRGLALLTEDRHAEGLCLEASIADNIALVSLSQHTRPPAGLLNLRALANAVAAIRQSVRLTPTARDGAPVKTLSGGNQQKVVLAKWLLANPNVLILDEPTRGIDVGARFEIYQLIVDLADRGAGVLLISSELEELIGLCDRILVMRRGEIVDELNRAEFDRERILRGALGA